MEIRLATAGDKKKILKYDCHIPHSRVEACIGRGMVAVLCDGGDIVGVLRYSLFWQSIPFLDLLYIDEACRGQGWGRKMMEFWEETMKDMGNPHVMLSTQEDETARYFYEKLGCRRIGAFLPPKQDSAEIMYLKELGYDHSDFRCIPHRKNTSCPAAAGSVPLSLSVHRPSENGPDPQRPYHSDAHGR